MLFLFRDIFVLPSSDVTSWEYLSTSFELCFFLVKKNIFLHLFEDLIISTKCVSCIF